MFESIQSLFGGFSTALTLSNVLYCLAGAIIGLFVGAMPGLGSVTGVALLLPLTFNLNPTAGIIMLCAIYYANMYGGAYSAILLNIPGDSSAIMTAMDGYPMAKAGKAGKALFTANLASFIGGTVGMIILTLTGASLARIGLKFGPAEMTSLLLLAMTSLGWLLGDQPIKGIISALLGLLVSCIGVGMSGSARLNFGIYSLLSGIPFVPIVIGMFGFSQMLTMMRDRHIVREIATKKITMKDSIPTREEVRTIVPICLRDGIIGTLVGVLPGAGATIANFIGYMAEKNINRNGEKFGTGVIEGIAASESSNNACVSGALAPTLALGIPGSSASAVLLGGLIMWGLTPGPMLYTKQPDFVWALIASLYLANVITLTIGTACIPFVKKIATVKSSILIPLITVVCFLGAYSSEQSMYGVIIMLVAAGIGYIFNRNDYPAAPFLLAFVLGSTLEKNFRQAMLLGDGTPRLLFTQPLSVLFLLLLVLCLVLPVVNKKIKQKKEGNV